MQITISRSRREFYLQHAHVTSKMNKRNKIKKKIKVNHRPMLYFYDSESGNTILLTAIRCIYTTCGGALAFLC